METSAKTAMNVNDIFMAIGMLDVFCTVCLWRILINARVIRLPYLTESSALQKWLCYDEPYNIGVHLKTHSVVVKTRSVCFAYTFTVFIVYQWRDREVFQFQNVYTHIVGTVSCVAVKRRTCGRIYWFTHEVRPASLYVVCFLLWQSGMFLSVLWISTATHMSFSFLLVLQLWVVGLRQ